MADLEGCLGAQTDIWKAYEQKVAEPMEKQKSKTARQKYQTNEGYLGYRDLIWVRSAPSNMLHTLQAFSRSDCALVRGRTYRRI